MLLVGAGGYLSIVDAGTLLNYLKTTPYHLFANYTLSVIPLFILMGALASAAGWRATCSTRPTRCSAAGPAAWRWG
jgi:TRAP-type mannitol/chloroaromatic compound transport system permease large subunit